ncbi:rhombosortase [Neptunomonas qingdaonensis]|nr:rhombosortase [Neptunomonas qingdaonensis]
MTMPWITVAFSTVVLGLGLLPDLFQLLYFDRSLIVEQQQWWRLLTGHLVHSSETHLVWDLLGFAVFSGIAECWHRKKFNISLGVALFMLNCLLLSPFGLERYCGLSGILCAPATLILWAHFNKQRDLLHFLPLLIAGLKLVVEASNADLLFAQQVLAQQGWPLYAPAHWVGVIAGFLSISLFSISRLGLRRI